MAWLFETIDDLLDLPSFQSGTSPTRSTRMPLSQEDSAAIIRLAGLGRTLRKRSAEMSMLYLAVTIVQAAVEAATPPTREDHSYLNNSSADLTATSSTAESMELHLTTVMKESSISMDGGHELLIRGYMTIGRLLVKMGFPIGKSRRPSLGPLMLGGKCDAFVGFKVKHVCCSDGSGAVEFISAVRADVEGVVDRDPLLVAAFYDECTRWCLKATEKDRGKPLGKSSHRDPHPFKLQIHHLTRSHVW